MDHTARNFHAHGGSEWVVGGKLTFLPGATVEGAEGLFDLPPGGGAVLPYIEDAHLLFHRQRGAAPLLEHRHDPLALREAGLMREPSGDAT